MRMANPVLHFSFHTVHFKILGNADLEIINIHSLIVSYRYGK
jgi:hypothetical protein